MVSDSLRPHGLQPARLLWQWDSPGKNTGVGCHDLLQGIFPTKASNPCLTHLLRWLQLLLLSCISRVRLCVTPQTAAHQATPSLGFSRPRTLEWVAISFSNAWKWKEKVKLLSPVPLVVLSENKIRTKEVKQNMWLWKGTRIFCYVSTVIDLLGGPDWAPWSMNESGQFLYLSPVLYFLWCLVWVLLVDFF